MKSRFWRAAAVAVVLATCSAQVAAGGHRHHYHGHRHYGGAGWWVGGALLGAGVALALSNRPRYAYSGVTYVAPPVVYPAPAYVAPAYVAPSVTYAAPPALAYAPPRQAFAPSGLNVIAYPAKGQSESQQMQDRQACENWAMNQSGLNPEQITEYTTAASADSYTRALGACFKGRGYSIN